MRQALTIVKILLIIILIIDLLLCLFAHATSHHIPLTTDVGFGVIAGVLLLLLMGVSYLGRRRASK